MTDQIQRVLQGAESGRALLDTTDAVLLLLDTKRSCSRR
jgi:hypothetical protein